MSLYTTVSQRVDVEMDIDLDEVIRDLPAKDKQQLARTLGINLAGSDDTYIRDAYDALMRNKPTEALAYLENYLFPNIGGRKHMKEDMAA